MRNPPLDCEERFSAMRQQKKENNVQNVVMTFVCRKYLATKITLSVKCPTIVFLQVYNVCSDTFDSYDQHYGRGLLKDTIKDGMWSYRHVFGKY